MRSLFLSGSALAVLAACTTTGVPDQTETVAVVEPPADTREVVTVSRDDWGEFGLDLASMKPGVEPGDDFFQYAKSPGIIPEV